MAEHENTTTGRDPAQRQRRRKKRMSREFSEDHTNESVESPSAVPERIPLQEIVDGEKVSVPRSASNNSGDQEGIQQSSVDRRNRSRRTRRRSRLENGDALYDEMESSTLDMPDKKKYKRPPSGVRQTRRSASAEMIDRDEDEGMADNENMSPARRRPRRKRNQGSRDVINGEEYSPEYEGYDGPRDPNKLRSKKHKTKKSRQHNGTSAEEDNYNADVDGEASTADYYRVDKEDIVIGDTQETAPPPALPPVAQTLPSQPLDVLFIERRDGHGFTRERKTRMLQLEEEKKEPQSAPINRQMTTAEFAVSVHRAFRSFSLFCHGLLAGLALCQVIFVYSLSNNGTANGNFLENYYKLAQPLQSLYYMLFAICTVSVFDRYDMANPRSGFFQGLLTRPSRILSISAYLFALVFSISVANIDDRISLYKEHGHLWNDTETSSLLDTWRIINLMRVLGAVLGWILVALQPTKDYTAKNLYEGELLPGEQRVTPKRPPTSEPQQVV